MICQKREPRPSAGRGLGNPQVGEETLLRGLRFANSRGVPKVPHGTAPLLTGHHAQTPAVLDHSRTLPQGDGCAGPEFAGGAERGEGKLVIFDASNVLDDAFPVSGPRIDAEGEMSS